MFTLKIKDVTVHNMWINLSFFAQFKYMKNGFSQVLRQIMKEKGLNQQKLADILEIRQSQISNWLNGKSFPGYYSLKLICEKLNVSADFLLEL